MQIKFVKTKKMLTWRGAGGLWRDGQVQDLRDDVAERLLGLYESPFVKVGEKSISPSSDKMIHQAEETKAEGPTADWKLPNEKKPEKPLGSLIKRKLGRKKR